MRNTCSHLPSLSGFSVALFVWLAACGDQRSLSDRDQSTILNELGRHFDDPSSLELRDLRASLDINGTRIVCGDYNVKNSMGGYVGFQPFAAFLNSENDNRIPIAYKLRDKTLFVVPEIHVLRNFDNEMNLIRDYACDQKLSPSESLGDDQISEKITDELTILYTRFSDSLEMSHDRPDALRGASIENVGNALSKKLDLGSIAVWCANLQIQRLGIDAPDTVAVYALETRVDRKSGNSSQGAKLHVSIGMRARAGQEFGGVDPYDTRKYSDDEKELRRRGSNAESRCLNAEAISDALTAYVGKPN